MTAPPDAADAVRSAASAVPGVADAVRLAEVAWSALVGARVRLTDPVDLGGSDRSAVLRVQVHGPGGLPATAVIKAYPVTDGFPPDEFGDEVAAAAFAPNGPRWLAHDAFAGVAVFTDLGSHLNLAEVLLGSDPVAARAGVLAWADALGSLAVWSVGRRVEYDRVRSDLGLPPTGDRLAERLRVSASAGVVALTEFAGPPEFAGPSDAALHAELADAATALEPGPLTVFSPADACPDNNLLTPNGLKLLDYESAGYHSALLDAVYCRMPMPSCWCTFELPSELATAAEQAYRNHLRAAVPEADDDAAWELGMLRAEVIWVLSQASWLIRRASAVNDLMGEDAGGPPRRTLLVHRWRRLAASERARQRYPQLVQLLEHAVARAEQRWGPVPALGGYPAFMT